MVETRTDSEDISEPDSAAARVLPWRMQHVQSDHPAPVFTDEIEVAAATSTTLPRINLVVSIQQSSSC
jgi:hypothetical protein